MLVTERKCDVYGTHRSVVAISVKITSRPFGGAALRTWDIDVSDRAYQRLIRFIERGLKPLVAAEVVEDATGEGLEAAAAASPDDTEGGEPDATAR